MSMSEEDIHKLARDAAAEQGIEGAECTGRLAGALYQNLLRGTPPKLAATLTCDWFYLQLHKVLWPNDPAQPPFWDISRGGEEEE